MAELVSLEDKYQNRFNRSIAGTLPQDKLGQAIPVSDSDQEFHRTSIKTDKADIRLCLGKYYLVVMFGKERRSEERLAEDRKMHPILTRANIRAILYAWLLVFFIALMSQSTLY